MDKSEFNSVCMKYLQNVDIKLNNTQLDMLYIYMNEMLEWNKKFNLTAITEPEEIILKHFIDSMLVAKYVKEGKVIDIGTGAGFPGIPLKIYKPELEIVLLDSLNKRVNFLNNILEKLKLNGIYAVHGRAEDMGKLAEYREKFDFATSRAVANMEMLSEFMIPFVKKGGLAVCMKGQIKEELEKAEDRISALGGKVINVDNYTLPLTDMERSMVVIKKMSNTPSKYPRSFSQIKSGKK